MIEVEKCQYIYVEALLAYGVPVATSSRWLDGWCIRVSVVLHRRNHRQNIREPGGASDVTRATMVLAVRR